MTGGSGGSDAACPQQRATAEHVQPVSNWCADPGMSCTVLVLGGNASTYSDCTPGTLQWELLTWRTPWEREGKNPFQARRRPALFCLFFWPFLLSFVLPLAPQLVPRACNFDGRLASVL